MWRLRLVPIHTTIQFMRWRYVAFTATGLLSLLAISAFALRGVNEGIDFAGGIVIEARAPAAFNMGDLRSTLSDLGLGEVALQQFGDTQDVLIRVQRQPGDDAAQKAAAEKVRTATLQKLGQDVSFRRIEFVGPKVSKELVVGAVEAVLLSLIGIMIYVWFRFEWQYGVGAVVTTMHDVVMTVGFFAVTGLEFNLSSVAAILTIAGYSINDTVVVYDRVRENSRKYKTKPIGELLDLCINETLSRTTMTVATTLLALLALFLFGGEVIRSFTASMIFGIVIGTYSSIFVAAPLLIHLHLKRGSEKEEAAPAPAQVG